MTNRPEYDDYDAEFDQESLMDSLAICDGFRCPDPRRGPFFRTDDGESYCKFCLKLQVLGEDINDLLDDPALD
jgi:hypothetical protein